VENETQVTRMLALAKGPKQRLSQYRRMFSNATVFFCICFPQNTHIANYLY